MKGMHMSNDVSQNWTTSIMQEIAITKQQIQAHEVSARMYSAAAWKIGPMGDYEEYIRLQNLSDEHSHLCGLARYRLRAIEYDLNYDLGKYDNDEYYKPFDSDAGDNGDDE
jgi:hypothetical protein